MPKPDYDTSLARMAGNIAAGMVRARWFRQMTANSLMEQAEAADVVAADAVQVARAIIREIKATTPKDEVTL
jgi:hypothetical protein